jgi:hypothetical protein
MDCKVVVKCSMYKINLISHLIYMDRKAQGLIGDGLSLEPVGTFQATYNKNTLEIHTNHQKIA